MFNIISAYQDMRCHVRTAREDLAADRQALWERLVLDASWERWAAGEFNEARTRRELSHPIHDLDGLEREVELLQGGQVEAAIAAAYTKIAGLLPYHEEPAAICVMAADPGNRWLVEQSHGVMGACIGSSTLLTINPTGQDWQAWIPYILAHERHHSAWGYHHYFIEKRPPQGLIDSLISEGCADAFAHLVCPDLHPSWVAAIDPAEESRQWQAMQPFLFAPDPAGAIHRRFFFGQPGAGTPANTGYTTGFHLVQAYLRRHPAETVWEWTTTAPEKILAESGYGTSLHARLSAL